MSDIVVFNLPAGWKCGDDICPNTVPPQLVKLTTEQLGNQLQKQNARVVNKDDQFSIFLKRTYLFDLMRWHSSKPDIPPQSPTTCPSDNAALNTMDEAVTEIGASAAQLVKDAKPHDTASNVITDMLNSLSDGDMDDVTSLLEDSSTKRSHSEKKFRTTYRADKPVGSGHLDSNQFVYLAYLKCEFNPELHGPDVHCAYIDSAYYYTLKVCVPDDWSCRTQESIRVLFRGRCQWCDEIGGNIYRAPDSAQRRFLQKKRTCYSARTAYMLQSSQGWMFAKDILQ